MKKKLTMLLALVLVAGISVAGTLAYLTSTSALVENTFTVGKVAITLDEKDVASEDRVLGNEYKLIPGSKYAKDPTVHVAANSEKSYVFIHVVNGLGDSEQATAGEYKNIADQIVANGWTTTGTAGYYYKEVEATTANVDLVVFTEFAIKGDLSEADYAALASAKITIQAFAIQNEGLSLAEAIAQFPADF